MTAQVNDLCRYKGVEYSLPLSGDDELFDISDYALEPSMASTACWRGYQSIFAVKDSLLLLDELRVNLIEENSDGERTRRVGPSINGVDPCEPEEEYAIFNNIYKNVRLETNYSGSILITSDFIHDLYIHLGFHPEWKYETVLKLIFENGILVKEENKSQKFAEIRKNKIEEGEISYEGGNLYEGEVYITRATKEEAKLKERGVDEGIIDGVKRKVRPKLVYHTNRDCELAHQDYVVDGEFIAPNSGVILDEYRDHLEECLMCKFEGMEVCSKCSGSGIMSVGDCGRCGGKGYIKRYNHVQGGVCFKCNGRGSVKSVECSKCNGNGVVEK